LDGLTTIQFHANLAFNNICCRLSICYGINQAEVVQFDLNYDLITQRAFVNESSEGGDIFEASLASGDFDGNGVDDIIIGVPQEDLEARGTASVYELEFGNMLIQQQERGFS
jgi:hypothetical protein